MQRYIDLDPKRLTTKKDMGEYLTSLFEFQLPVTNLDALHDALSEISQDTILCVSRYEMKLTCEEEYAWRTLMVISEVTIHNPHLHLLFTEDI